jgi:hypothetical protein
MAKIRALLLASVVLVTATLSGCYHLPFFYSPGAPWIVPVPPWVTERMQEKYCDEHRTPIMPPILPGQPPVFCMDPPTEEEAVKVLPKVARGIPFFYEEFRDDFTVVVELIADQIDPCAFVPLIGPAQLHHCHYKCTVYFRERISSDYPFPFECVKDRVEVVYIDKDHFHLCVGDSVKMQKAITRDLTEGR